MSHIDWIDASLPVTRSSKSSWRLTRAMATRSPISGDAVDLSDARDVEQRLSGSRNPAPVDPHQTYGGDHVATPLCTDIDISSTTFSTGCTNPLTSKGRR